MKRISNRKTAQKGHSILEFALIAFPTLTMLFGTVVIGINLGRSVQVAQINRDSDAMFVRGIDFSQSGNQAELARLGQALNLQTTGGDGLVILSRIQFIPDASCGAPTSSTYPNCTVGKNVLVQRISIGNTALYTTHYPTAGNVTQDGQGNVANYSTDANAVISTFTSSLQLKPNEVSYVSETYFRTSDVSMPGFQSNPGIYSQTFF